MYMIALGIFAGAVLGAATVQGLHARSGPKAYLVSETETIDAVALAAYVPVVQAALGAAGGRPAVISTVGGKVVPVVGEPPMNFVISEWESLAKGQAWLASPEWKALRPQREKSYRTIRQFIVEMAPSQ
jgi:uncharacterized protein (DUF1330 family)